MHRVKDAYIDMWEGDMSLDEEVGWEKASTAGHPDHVHRPQNADWSVPAVPLLPTAPVESDPHAQAENTHVFVHGAGTPKHDPVYKQANRFPHQYDGRPTYLVPAPVGNGPHGPADNQISNSYLTQRHIGLPDRQFYSPPSIRATQTARPPTPYNVQPTLPVQVFPDRVRPRTAHRQRTSGMDSDTAADSEMSPERAPRRRLQRRTPTPRARSRSPPKYDGKFDFLDFKVQFECIAEDNDWSYQDCGRKLSRCLTGSARSVLTTLDRSVRRDYQTLCAALLSLHTTPGGEGLRRTELHQAARIDGQCPSVFGRELRKLAARAYPLGDLPETALIQLFIKGLRDASIEQHVSLQAPCNLDDAIRQACAYRAYSSAEMPDLRKPKQPISVAKVASNGKSVEAQLSELSEKFEQLLTKVNGKKEIECYFCHEKGHIASKCPAKRQTQTPQTWQPRGNHPMSTPRPVGHWQRSPAPGNPVNQVGYFPQSMPAAPVGPPMPAAPVGPPMPTVPVGPPMPFPMQAYPECYNSLNA